MSPLLYPLIAVVAIVLYEGLRAWVLRAIRERLKARAKDYVRRHQVRLDRFKLTRRAFLKTELLADPVVVTAMEARAREKDLPVTWVYAEVEDYLDEIIPAFSLLSYFKVGLGLTRLGVNVVYDVIFDHARTRPSSARLPEDAVVLYLMNHRSNFDYLLVGLLLSRTIALSYAVGEWARVWPLDRLFRSFGSYFVRRGEKDPLYHLVLKRYVQKVSRYGITQGIFLEGGLSRDGFFREPKVGLLSYITELLADPDFDKELLVVPVAINYDRVLEDKVLLGELKTGAAPPSLLAKLRSGLLTLVTAPFVLVSNTLRVLTGRAKRHGYATARFGEPISVREFLSRGGQPLAALDERERRAQVKALAQEVMTQIGAIMPVTPVPLICLALLEEARAASPTQGWVEVKEKALEARVMGLHSQLRRQGHWLVGGAELASSRAAREHLEAERDDRRSALVDLEDNFVAGEEARETVELALSHLTRRGLVRHRSPTVAFQAADEPVLTYYAATLCGLLPGLEGRLRASPPPPSSPVS